MRVAIRVLRSKLLTASLSVASNDDPLNSANLIFDVHLLPHILKNKVSKTMAVDCSVLRHYNIGRFS